ncbi:NAD(P)-dependent oxidoreductase [Paenibacillus bovis]|uniref:NAD(P)-binding domain-containing protein n=1 Tax=Paenibacillus bovis TaxID=1616788 RepID=A0A172ZBI8_9BACL|nr:SDR family oxidoreductase [Paenibacillus bovis]ANF94988.1 hypothetical protein AR543_02370 [Paenibacillus bovis]
MNLIIFGATGRTGRELVTQALEQGYAVTAFVRDSTRMHMTHDNLKIVHGNIDSYPDILSVVQSTRYDAALFALGSKSPFRRNPVLNNAMKNIIRAMEDSGTERFIHISFVGTRPDAGRLGMMYRFVIPVFMRNLLADHREKEQLLRSSSLDWMIAQPPMLTNGPRTGQYTYSAGIDKSKAGKLKLSRANLAEFMLKQLEDHAYSRKEVFVTE